ncbi:TIGR01841 family phasin [Sphingosinithalassobacter sp. LHW66-3]|uniref:phasin family protein n=1 Tax=Sphingosinithalassobacter sp. LHW66-3 TaxID=3424718 RepID=UPI003D6B451A
MASKGPKTGGAKAPAVAPKPASRPRKVAPKAKVAASEAEKKAVPAPMAETAVPPKREEPAAAPVAVPQEPKNVEAAVEPAAEAPAKAVATEAVAAALVVEASAKKEAETMDTTVETNVNRAQAMFVDMNERTKAAVEKSTKMVEEMNDLAKGNLEAVVESSRITAKGFESLGQEAAEYGRKSFEEATAALKQMATVKSPAELFKLQSDFVRKSFDSYVAEASKNTEAMLKLAGDATQPLSNRFAVAAEKVKTAA